MIKMNGAKVERRIGKKYFKIFIIDVDTQEGIEVHMYSFMGFREETIFGEN